jgi:ubiquinone/menaquinone biosynthesis C-methylase UbiE
MKLNWIERLYVNSPIRLIAQYLEVQWFTKKRSMDAGGNILEIGCGRGVGAGFIHEKFKPDQLYLLDLDLEMVTRARLYLNARRPYNINFCLGNAAYLPFKNGYFDAVFGFGFLHHVPEWRLSLAEVTRVLKKGGAYYLVEFYPQLYQNKVTRHLLVHPESDRFKSRDLKEAFQALNLSLADTFELKNTGIIGIGIKS